ncbi:MAG: hypothetical protein LW823_03810 [Rickettsiales bacterium]|jgi:hypothetical protein|nr:hypothetical protein [Rickettsiales bacterium]
MDVSATKAIVSARPADLAKLDILDDYYQIQYSENLYINERRGEDLSIAVTLDAVNNFKDAPLNNYRDTEIVAFQKSILEKMKEQLVSRLKVDETKILVEVTDSPRKSSSALRVKLPIGRPPYISGVGDGGRAEAKKIEEKRTEIHQTIRDVYEDVMLEVGKPPVHDVDGNDISSAARVGRGGSGAARGA